MSGIAGFILAVLVFVVLVPFYASSIEERIRGETEEALISESFPTSGLIVEGRDVTLTGPIDSEDSRVRAERAVRTVRGVRIVRNFLVVQLAASRLGRQREIQVALDELLKARAIEFSANGKVAESGLVVLDEVAAILAKHPDVLLEVQGHAEWLGDSETSKRMSERIGESAASRLVSRGIAKDRLSVVGYGAEHPVAPHSTVEGRARNRRIQFQVK